jgi:hypothetical protein
MKLFFILACLISNQLWAADSVATMNNLQTQALSALLKKSTNDIAFGLYLRGPTLNFNGEKVTNDVSSNPKIDMVNYHKAQYCSKNVQEESKGLACDTNWGDDSIIMEFGDIKAGSLLMPTVYTKLMDVNAQMFIRNIVQPFPDNQWRLALSTPSNAISKGQNNKVESYANSLAKQAVYDVARFSLNNSYATRLSSESFAQYATPVGENSVSILSMMEKESTKWFDAENFDATGAGQNYSTQLAFLQSMAKMQSFQLWMNFQQYKQLERIETLLAASLASSVGSSIDSMNPNASR